MSKILIPACLQAYSNFDASVPVQAGTVGLCLQELLNKYPLLTPYIYDEKRNLQEFTNIYVDGEDIRALQSESTVVNDAAVVTLLPSMAGG